ncbi:hypothetical protein BGW37DRAFT_534069 [Umbelopsis sp. PMI_123]|nr:hypothetical protein BGW37DRAFT_534069 [Umbelopsis sp. PMI_123]
MPIQATQSAINWPDRYLPGTTDNYVSNEIILTNTSEWPKYYSNVSDITFLNGGGPELKDGLEFSFSTIGFPPLASKIVEFIAPVEGQPARLSCTAKQDGTPEQQLEVLPVNRLRVLTQESQIGKPAAQLAKQKPNPMLNGHQDWLDGLRDAASCSK